MEPYDLYVIGGGGHARVVISALQAAGVSVAAIVDSDPARQGARVLGVEVVGTEDVLADSDPARVVLANGLGSVRDTAVRRAVYERWSGRGFTFAAVRHPSAVVAVDAVTHAGAQLMAGVVVQPGTVIGANAVLNTRCSVDHDCRIGRHAHLAPGVTVSGGVTVGEGAHVGTGATIIESVSVGPEALVAAGAVVVSDVASGARVAGVPARPM